ncbi:hypothetical protein [Francisella sp. SYW-9]|uniref:hypothetical protein n=1 Tax=Francisella sp. SYW-9 TaxID=2610888 RepID=UPI00123D400C|nr:hypothetical protein [Francisella sp. SYW-9]
MMGYCSFIDWIQGYPEVKAEITKQLEDTCYGDKFEVWDITWSDNLGAYNFEAKDVTRNITEGGSYFPKTNTLYANGFMWSVVSGQWRDIFKPYIEKVSNNYLIIGGVGTQDPVDYKKYKIDYRKQALHNLFSMEDIKVSKGLAKDHNSIQAYISIFVEVPENAQGIYQTLQVITAINNKLKSYHLYSYRLTVTTYTVPQGFNISKYFDEVSPGFHTSYAWYFEEGIQKYAWGYFDVRGCMPTDAFEKYCNTYKEVNNPNKLDTELIKQYTLANRLNTIDNVMSEFRLVDNVGEPDKCTKSGNCYAQWDVNSRAHKHLKDS